MEEHTPHTPHTEAPSSRSAAALRELQSRAQAVMTSRRERLSRLEAEITERLDTIAESIAGERAAEAKAETEAHEAQAEIERQREQLDERNRQLDDRVEQLDELARQSEARQTAIDQQAAEIAGREEELAKREQALDEREQAADSVRADRDTDEQMATQRESAWQVEREALERERDELQAALTDARATADASAEQSEAAAERDELRQKFALAHEDVQRFRARVTELEEELARRPESGQADSAELVSLRAERDALSERVEALEQLQPASQEEGNSDQMSDLQRRFEMAVEDVRELKTRNAELESQVAAVRRPLAGGGGGDGGEMDWESQKRRLLESLEGDGDAAGDDDDPERQAERTTIASTIEITDAVVAEKDQVIEALKAQLAESSSKASSPDDERERAVNELLDADEIVKQHCEKIAQLEQEMEQKLRAAEMELSVERASMARKKVELDKLQADLKSQRESLASGSGASASGVPKRRWLSKLGLGSEDGQ